jgi:hypothetical protein
MSRGQADESRIGGAEAAGVEVEASQLRLEVDVQPPIGKLAVVKIFVPSLELTDVGAAAGRA